MKKCFVIIAVILGFIACKSKNDIYIPKDKFTSILADLHMADAHYSSHYEESKLHNDSVNFYNYIINEYGYTRKQFDTTLKYYTVNSEELNNIFEDVITILNKTEQENYQLQQLENSSAQNLWRGKNKWILPKEGSQKKIPINLKLKGKGKYIITFNAKVFSDDKSKNLRLKLYFAAGSGKTEKRDTAITYSYTKDARTSIVALTRDLKNPKYTHLRGYLLQHDKKSGDWSKHLIIENLKVLYIP
jgi:hypothetical protein